jgi:hypothetical protein
LCQERQEEEDARDAGVDRAAGFEFQLATVRDVRRFGAGSVLAFTRAVGSPAPVGEKKGVATPWRQLARNRLAIDLSAEG